MIRRFIQGLSAGVIVLAGCLYPVAEKVDGVVCDLARRPRDLQPIFQADLSMPAEVQQSGYQEAKPGKEKKEKSADKESDDLPRPKSLLEVPLELLPGGHVPPITLPPSVEGNEEARKNAIERLYPPLPELGEDLPFPPGAEGRPLTLADLQRLGLSTSPLIKQATAHVEEARGSAIQAGLAPNPTVGFEADTVGTAGSAGYVGGFIEQTIKTGSKLQLARAIAAMDLRSAELALFKAQADLATRVRTGYFAVLAAQESVRLNRALARFTTDVYRIQVEQVRQGGFAAPYEPMYLRALAIQARAALVQARNRRTAAWKQLAATLGLPGMPPTQLAGRLDIPVPVFSHKDVLATALARHTNIRTSEAELQQAQFQLELAKQTPIPDVTLRMMLQKDRTSVTGLASPSVVVGMPIPVWDRNQGNILAAQAAILRTREGSHRARSELTSSLAEAFERYENNRTLLGYYRDLVLPDLVRVYRGVRERYQREPGGAAGAPPAFTDVVVAQQNLAQAVGTYITTLAAQWQAVADVADHMQTFDLFGIEAGKAPVAEIPTLEGLPALPCCHPCSPVPGLHHHVVDGHWQQADVPASAAPAATPGKSDTGEREKRKEEPKKDEAVSDPPLLILPKRKVPQ